MPEHLITSPKSPDISPIEHLCDLLDLECAIRKHKISFTTDLKNDIINEWNNITNKNTSYTISSSNKIKGKPY